MVFKSVYFKLVFLLVVLVIVSIASVVFVQNKSFNQDGKSNNNNTNSVDPNLSNNSILQDKKTKITGYREPDYKFPKYTDSYEKELTELGKVILTLLKNKDMATLSSYVHDDLGLNIKPYYSSSQEQGRNLNLVQVKSFFNDKKEYQWGLSDGSGLPIVLTNNEYFNKYLYDNDFLNSDYHSYNSDISAGNNFPLDSFIPELFEREQVRFIEYYFGGFEEQYDGMDWQALSLVFVKLQDKWYIAGIFHNEWTI